MGPGETAGIVIVTVAVIQGSLKLVEHLVSKYNDRQEEAKLEKIAETLAVVQDKIGNECGLNEIQSQQLKDLHDMHSHRDKDGVPLWFVPRSWADTQKELVDRLQKITEIEFKILGIIERLERRLEVLDKRD
jgi:hypothetical protein